MYCFFYQLEVSATSLDGREWAEIFTSLTAVEDVSEIRH
jgi:hypothetical protein